MANDWRDVFDSVGPQSAAPAGLPAQQDDTSGGWRSTFDSMATSTQPRQPAWQTGGNLASTQNGWDTPFYQTMFAQRDKHLEAGTLGKWYDQKDFTGVVTWRQGDKKLGDIYENGKRVGNLLDRTSGFEEGDAYTMLAELTLDDGERAQAFKRLPTDPNAVKKAVLDRYEQSTKEVAGAASQQAFQDAVQAQKDDWDDTAEGWAAFGAGALGGAGVGLVGGPWGALAGGVIGGVGALLNKDTIIDQAARASVQTGMAAEEFGAGGALATGARTWAGAAMSAISPLQNLVQGTTDAVAGEIGDDESAYYAMEDRPAWLTALNLGATLGDSLLQFGSGVGTAAFMATTGTSVLGGAGQLVLQGGATFDDRTGTFHAPENLGQLAAAIGAVGIDAIQLGGAGAISRAAREAVGLPSAASHTIAGRKFILDETGQVADVKRTLTLLAPSEAVQFASVRVQAFRLAARERGALSPDDMNRLLYQASKDLEQGTNLARTAFVNAFGEGLEEATQAVLEPLSHGWTPELGEIYEAYLSGAAAGAGMSLGARIRYRPTSDNQFIRANMAQKLAGLPTYTEEEWAGLSSAQRAAASALPAVIEKGLRQRADRVRDEMVDERVRFVAGAERLDDAARLKMAQEMRKLNPAEEGTYSLTQVDGAHVPSHVVQVSWNTLGELLDAQRAGLEEQLATFPDRQVETQEILDALSMLRREMEQTWAQAGESIEAGARAVNELLELAWNSATAMPATGSAYSPAAKAVTLIFSRDPNNSSGSFQGLLPQVSAASTRDGGDGVLQVSQAILKAIDGDFDGDKMRERVRFLMDDDVFRTLRLGTNFLASKDSVPNIPVRTYEEQQIRRLALTRLNGPSNQAANATATLDALHAWLVATLPTVPDIRRYADDFVAAVKAGNVDAKAELLQTLATEATKTMYEIGEQGSPTLPPMSNVWLAIDTEINRQLQWFTEQSAARDDATPNLDSVQAILPNSSRAEIAAKQAATPGQTLQQNEVGADPFRNFQKLPYSGYRSPTVGAEITNAQERAETAALIEFYNQLSSGLKQTAVEELYSKDEITRNATRMLVHLAKEMLPGVPRMEAVGIIAGLAVPDVRRDRDGWSSDGRTTTLAQLVLREAVSTLRARDSVLAVPGSDLAKKYDMYESVDAGAAFRELFDEVPMVALMGEAAHNFGANLSFGQVHASYLNRSSASRKAFADRVKSDVRYNRAAHHDLPYRLEEIESRTVTGYQVILDALFLSANGTLSVDAKGDVHGRLAERDRDQIVAVETGIEKMQAVLRNMGGLYKVSITKGRRVPNAPAIAALLDANPDVARAVLALLPTDIVHTVIQSHDDGTVSLPTWFFEMLSTSSPKEAAMQLFRQSLISQLNVHAAQKNPRRSEDRLVALVHRLQQTPEQGLRFQKLLYGATDVRSFMRQVNREFLQNEAPQLAWFRDAAQFDATYTQGGWTRTLPGAELREAVSKFETAATRFGEYSEQEKDQDALDAKLVPNLLEALAQRDQGKDSDTIRQLEMLEKRIQDAAKLLSGMGPAAMKLAPLAAALGLFGGATDKGKAAEAFAVDGAHDARGQSLTWATGTEQLIDKLTASDAQDAASNPAVLAGDDARILDDQGRQIDWTQLDARRFLELWMGGRDENGKLSGSAEYRPMLRAIVFPTVWEQTHGENLEQQSLISTSLTGLVTNDTYLRALRGRNHVARMEYASMLDALAEKHGGNHEIQRLASDLLIAWTGGAHESLEADELATLRDEAFDVVVDLVRTAAEAQSPQLLKEARDALSALRRANRTGTSDSLLAATIEKSLVASLGPQSLPENASPEEIEAAKRREARMQQFLRSDAFAEAQATYSIDWSSPDVTSKQELLYSFVLDHPSLKGPEVAWLRSLSETNARGTVPLVSANEAETREIWDSVSRSVISARVKDAATVSLSEDFHDLPSGDTEGRLKYLKQDYSYLAEDVLDPNSSLMLAAAELRSIVLGTDYSPSTVHSEDLVDALGRVFDPQRLGPWTMDIAKQSIDAQNRIDSSGAGQQVARAGIAYAKQSAIAQATRRTYRDPAQDGYKPRAFRLAGSSMQDFLAGTADHYDLAAGLLDVATAAPEPIAALNGRFLTSAVLRWVDATGARQELNLFEQRVAPGNPFFANADARRTGYLGTSPKQLRTSIARNLPANATQVAVDIEFFHPADAPGTPDYANNLFFEGKLFEDAGDHYGSLTDGLWFSPAGLNVIEQLAALKANKKGRRALRNPVLPKQDDVVMLEDLSDFYGMLREKTLFLMRQDPGHGKLDPTFYPAIFQSLKLRHGLRGIVDGQVHLFSAEEVIAYQAKAPGKLPQVGGKDLEQPELVTLSSRALRTLLGEQGTLGLLRPLTSVPTISSEGANTWRGSLEEYAAALPGLTEIDPATGSYARGAIQDTPIARRRSLQQLTVRPPIDRRTSQAYARRMEVWHGQRDLAELSRSGAEDRYKTGRARALEAIEADNKLFSALPELALYEMGVPVAAPRGMDRNTEGALSAFAYAKLKETFAFNERAAGWIYVDDSSKGSKGTGVLHGLPALDAGDARAHGENVVFGDLVVVKLESFVRPGRGESEVLTEVTRVMHRLAGRGVTIALTDARGARETRMNASQVLESLGYKSVVGAPGLFQPADPESQFATVEAQLSRLAETDEIESDSTVVVFQSETLAVEEQAAIVNNASAKNGREVLLAHDLAPTRSWPYFGIAATDEQRLLVEQTYSALLTSPELLDHAAKLGGTTAAELRPFVQAAAASYDRTSGRPRAGEEFGPGDILALVNQRRQVILYRHGFEPFDPEKLEEQLNTQHSTGPGNLAVYTANPMQSATTHRGTVQSWEGLNGYGLGLMLRVPLQALGNKTVLERNGMKLVGFSIDGTDIQLPDFGPLDGWDIDYLISRADSLSKENFAGVIDNARAAFTYLGADFVPAIAQTLFELTPTQWAALGEQERRDMRLKVTDALNAVRRTERVSLRTINELMRMLHTQPHDLDGMLGTLAGSPEFAAVATGTNWATATKLTPQEQITRAAVLYMLSPDARPEHILSATGFGTKVTPGLPQSRRMPRLFTQVFDDAPLGSPLRDYIFEDLNTRLQNQRTPGRQQGYTLMPDWTFVIRNADATKDLTGYLQFAVAHSSGDNPTTAEQARARKQDAQASRQQTLVAERSLGARLSEAKKLKKTQRYITREGLQKVETTDDLFALMSGGRTRPVRPQGTRRYLPAELAYLEFGRVAMEGFRQPIDTSVWDDPNGTEKAAFDAARERIALTLGLTEADKDVVDGWIRQWFGAPKDAKPETQGGYGALYPKDVKEALREIELNLQEGLYPTWGAELPIMHYNDVLLLFNARHAATWTPRKNDNGDDATTWAEYVNIALGMRDTPFDHAWQTPLDGFLHSYRDAGDGLGGLPLSTDDVMQMQLLDPTTNQMVLSFNPDYRALLSEPVIASVSQATFEDFFGGTISDGRYLGNYPPASAITNRRKRMRNWEKEQGAGQAVGKTRGDLEANGARFVSEGTTTNALVRTLTNIRAANGMLNPYLFAVAPVEAGLRNILEDAANLLTGDSLSQLTARISTNGAETLAHAKRTYQALGANAKFKSMVYTDLFSMPKAHNAGRLERASAALAKLGGKFQDPTYGMLATTAARRYVEAAIREVVVSGSATTLTPEALLTLLDRDPLVLEKRFPEIHQAALNTLANVRSLKPTVPALAFRGVIDPLTSNPRWYVNLPSALMLKIPYLFLSYGANVATNMLGLQGLNAVAAVALQGRGPGKKFGKLQAFLQGVDYDSSKHGIDFVNETLESVDLAGAFIRSGLTHTALMGLGLAAGSLGLTGEDDEDRRRRRAEKLQGAAHVYDPRDIANDFRNADAIFFDNLPDWIPFAGALKEMFQVTGEDAPGGARSMANLHWTLKQFISPIMGIEKFLDTGNFMHVVWGFEDALGSMPLVNAQLWDDASQLSAEMYNAAIDAEQRGTPEDLAESYGLMLNSVMNLERMLFENSFVNSLYVASDAYDRDPWTLADVGIDGKLVRDNLGQPMPTNMLQQFIDADGNVAEGRVRPDWFSGQMKQLGENRATLAFFGSLFTGFDNQDTLWRHDQTVRVRKIDKEALDTEAAEALILSMWDEDNQRETLTRAGGEAVIQGLRMGTVRPGDPALENVFISFDDRLAITESLTAQIMQEGLDAGLDHDAAERRFNELMYGSSTNPYAIPLNDVIWGRGKFEGAISYSPTASYAQLNTTYVLGPDGRPWATGIGRDKFNNWWGQAPLQRFNVGDASNMGVDERLNSTDEPANMNTGLRNLTKIDDTWANPTDEDILAAVTDATKKIIEAIRTPSWSDSNRYYGGGYGSGGYSSGGSGYSYRVNSPTRNDPTNSRNTPYVNVDNPIIRRASIRRERFSSTKGRLNPWQ